MNRKAYLAAVCIAVFAITPASAQLHGGVLGGLNLASLSYDPEVGFDLSGRTGLAFGALLDLGLGQESALRMEPMIIQKGGVRTADGVDNEIDLTYVEIPILLRFDITDGRTRPYLMAGPMFGFVMDAKVTDKATGTERDMKDDLKSLDFNLGFGLGISVRANRNQIFFEGRYALGSTDINGIGTTNAPEVKTSGFQFFLGYSFFLADV